MRGYHVYKDVWKPSIGEKLVAKREFNNPMDKHAVKVVKDDETVGHLPREFSRIAWYFLARSGEISVEVIGRRRHCKQQSADETLKRTGEQDSGIEPADANKRLL